MRPILEVPKIDLTGQRFTNLIVLGFSHYQMRPSKKTGKVYKIEYWNCTCDCGNSKLVTNSNLKAKNTTSCGCTKARINKERAANTKDNNHGARGLFSKYKSGAKNRKLEFNLTLEQFMEITSKDCYLCGNSPSHLMKAQGYLSLYIKPYVYNGIDRFNNDEGYTYNNSKACCHSCNFMKHSRDIKTFISQINQIIENVNSNKELLELINKV